MSRKVLIIDDDADFLEAVGLYLESHDFEVITASNDRDGLQRGRAERPDVILLDVVMEERTEGFFTLQQMRRTAELERTPIFVVSSIYSAVPGFSITPEKSWLRHDDFIAKPVDLPALVERIRKRLEDAGTGATIGATV
jgi:DNA-binding response OmpR family regulator